jgi:hypothetical protein
MRALVVIALAMILCGPAAFAGHHDHKLHKKIKEAHQAHAHKHKMKKAMHEACKSQKEHPKLLHHHKGGGQ